MLETPTTKFIITFMNGVRKKKNRVKFVPNLFTRKEDPL